MLYVHVSRPEDMVRRVDIVFKHLKNKDWFNDPFVKEIIKGIDNSIAVKDEYIESPVFGGMAPEKLSSGCKAVILMWMQDKPVYATSCGDNCAEWIIKTSQKKDVHIFLAHYMGFPYDFDATFIDSGLVTHTSYGFLQEFDRLRSAGVAKGNPVPVPSPTWNPDEFGRRIMSPDVEVRKSAAAFR